MGFLQAAGIKRDREALFRVGQKVTHYSIGVSSLGHEYIDWPYRILRSITEFHKEHLPKYKFCSFSAFFSSILSTCVFIPKIDVFLKLTRDLHVSRIVGSEYSLQCHSEPVSIEYLARLHYSNKKYTSFTGSMAGNFSLQTLSQVREQLTSKDLAPEVSIEDDQGIGSVVHLEKFVKHRPFHEFTIHLDRARTSRRTITPWLDHGTQLFQSAYTKVSHHATEGASRIAVSIQLKSIELVDRHRRTDDLKTSLSLIAIDDPHKLDEEWVEVQLIVSTVGCNQRYRRCRTRSNTPLSIREGPNVGSELIQNTRVLPKALPDVRSDIGQCRRVEHG